MWKTKYSPWFNSIVPLLTAITWRNCFLYDFISLSHGWEGILDHSSCQGWRTGHKRRFGIKCKRVYLQPPSDYIQNMGGGIQKLQRSMGYYGKGSTHACQSTLLTPRTTLLFTPVHSANSFTFGKSKGRNWGRDRGIYVQKETRDQNKEKLKETRDEVESGLHWHE